MRSGLFTPAFLTFLAKAITAFWALLVLAVAAALQAKLNSAFGSGIVNNSNLSGASALIAAAVFTIVYFVAQIILQSKKPEMFILAVFIDVTVIGFIMILTLGGIAAESTESGLFDHCSDFRRSCDYGGLGKAVLGLGWLFWFMLLGLFLWEMIYTFMRFGAAWSTWKTPFPILLDRGAPSSNRGLGSTDVESKAAVPMAPNPATHNYTPSAPPPVTGPDAGAAQTYTTNNTLASAEAQVPASETAQPQAVFAGQQSGAAETGSYHGSRSGTPHVTQQQFPQQQG